MSITPKETSINEASSGTFCHEIKSESNVNKVKKETLFFNSSLGWLLILLIQEYLLLIFIIPEMFELRI